MRYFIVFYNYTTTTSGIGFGNLSVSTNDGKFPSRKGVTELAKSNIPDATGLVIAGINELPKDDYEAWEDE